jgi:hypothetical protein
VGELGSHSSKVLEVEGEENPISRLLEEFQECQFFWHENSLKDLVFDEISAKDKSMIFNNRCVILVTSLTVLGFFCGWQAKAAALQTNATQMSEYPSWINKTRVDKVVERIQNYLEWSVRRVNVVWYKDAKAFAKMHGLSTASVLAISRKDDNSIHLGPKVTNENFDAVFGHEMAHIISFQKYKGAIPAWLEEGLANHVAQAAKVDYAWLSRKPFPADVQQLGHPLAAVAEVARYRYMASQALIEMISAKCDLKNLLRLSVARKMSSYLETYCEIKDINASFKKWVKLKAASGASGPH